MVILQHSKITFTCFAFTVGILWKRYLGLESKSLGRCRWPSPPGLDTYSFVHGFEICGL